MSRRYNGKKGSEVVAEDLKCRKISAPGREVNLNHLALALALVQVLVLVQILVLARTLAQALAQALNHREPGNKYVFW